MIVITGPTASGKSALSVSVAKRLHTDVISADSRQVYGDIPVVTALTTPDEQQGVRHHLMGHLSLEDYYSASRFEEDALEIISHLFEERDTAVVCGGSMMYIDALCYGIDEIPTVPDTIRRVLPRSTVSKVTYGCCRDLRCSTRQPSGPSTVRISNVFSTPWKYPLRPADPIHHFCQDRKRNVPSESLK